MPKNSILKLSLGCSLFIVAVMLGAIFLVGAPEADAAVYTLTGSCGNCNWGTSGNWSGGPAGTFPGQVTGDTANICVTGATLTVDVVVPQGVILNMNCTGGTVNIPGTPAANSLKLETSSSMGSGGTAININGGNLTLNNIGSFGGTGGYTITMNSGAMSNA